ncbi:MAG: bifunctional 5,10-methylenetetrahydrofolate dehydrogenase/5,10-methenyltetrahydrofolate cyclohydrolase [Candidatus Paceibacterota bacterium]
MQIIDGRKLSREILSKVESEVASLPFQSKFCDVLVGNDPSSVQYVKMKAKEAESIGIKFHSANFPDSITTSELIKEIKILNKIKNMCGIIVQLPLPSHIDKQAVLDSIDPNLDVDCLGKVASEKFYSGDFRVGFPAALACMAILDSLNINLVHKKIICLGQGDLVGKPVSALLRFRGLDHVVITRKTPARNAYGEAVAGGEDKEKILKEADVIISGIGHGKHITGDMVKKGVVLIDAGTSESKGGIVGDVDLESVKDVAEYISPVPGGVGPVTVAMLLNNVLQVAKSFIK